MSNEDTNISLETYRRVMDEELQMLRTENLNLKIVIAQLREDKKDLQNTLEMTENIKRTNNKVVSLESRMAERTVTNDEGK